MTSFREILLNIEESGAFEELHAIEQTANWETFSQEDRFLFARLLLLQGRKQLAEGNAAVLESFNKACLISKNAAEIFFDQGMIFLEFKHNMRCIDWALEAFERAIIAKPTFIDAWYTKALTLVGKGKVDENPHYFNEADRCFHQVERLIASGMLFEKETDLYWKWGFTLGCLATSSGEPYDLQKAISKFAKAKELGCNAFKFFHHYGHACADLGALIDSPDYFSKALELFDLALIEDPTNGEILYDKACCLQCLADFHRDLSFLKRAAAAFEKATEANKHSFSAFFRWAQLEMMMGKITRDFDPILKSLTLYQKASDIESGHPLLLVTWADAELYLAGPSEDYEKIISAQKKLAQCLALQPNLVDAWYLSGSSYIEQARYFNDTSYCKKAIETFQKGISLSKVSGVLTYGLAQAYAVIGEIDDDILSLKKSLKYFEDISMEGEELFTQLLNDWGMTLLKLGDLAEQPKEVAMAVEKFAYLIEHRSSPEESRSKLEWLYNYGYALDLLGDLTDELVYVEKAIEVLAKVVETDPEFYQARFAFAIALWHYAEEAGDLDVFQNAIDNFITLLEIDGEDAVVHVDYGTALISLGLLTHDVHNPQHSRDLFQKAEHHLTQGALLGNLAAYYQLVGLYSISENYPLALHYLEKAQFFDALPSLEELLNDHWLDSLRQTQQFRQFLTDFVDKNSEEKHR